MSVADHYTYRVRWSADDGEYVGTVAELPSVSWLAETSMEAFAGIQRVAAEIVAEMRTSGEEPPAARPFLRAGRCVLRRSHWQGMQ